MQKKYFFRVSVLAAVLSVALLLPVQLRAQLNVTHGTSLPTGWTADSLVRNVLLGEGVEVYNVKFNNSTGVINCNAIGTFTTGTNATNLGISSGIIIGSGDVAMAAGANNSGSSSQASGCTSQTCAPLAAAASGSINDCAVLEFDFVPKSDSIKFRYVFASEEYPEFVCANVNDIFAFFISGVDPNPGNPTGMYNNKNIALIPNDTVVISINTVNGGTSAGSSTPCVLTNSQYYHDNSGSSTVQYDGFTTVLTAEAKVVPCAPYHLVIAIADVSDNIYDSGVFLEANSLSSNAIQFSFDNPSNPDNPSDLYEGCMARILLHRPSMSSVPTNIGIEIVGDVTNGQDFPLMNSTITFPADTQDMSITIAPTLDGTTEGTNGVEFAKILMSPANGCPNSDSVEFNIVDTWPMSAYINRDTLNSSSINIVLRDSVVGGMPSQSHIWYKRQPAGPNNFVYNEVGRGRSYTVFPLPQVRDSAIYMVEVSDSCGNYAYDTIIIGIRKNFATPPHDTIVCLGDPLVLAVRGADSCVWSANGGAPFELHDTIVSIVPQELTTYQIKSYITWNGQIWEDIDTLRVVVMPKPEVSLTASIERICEGQSVTLYATGSPNFSWGDTNAFSTTASKSYMPDTTTEYIVYGKTNGADCYGSDTIVIVVDTIPDIFFDGGGGVCDGEEVQITLMTTAESFIWSATPPDPTLTGQEMHNLIIVNPLQTTVYTVNAVNGVCHNDGSTTVPVEVSPVAIGEVSPKTVSLGSMEAVFTDRSEHSTSCKWEFPDGSVRTESQVSYLVPDDVDSINVRLWAYNPYMCFDTTTITVYVDHTTLWMPNAFTPEESTNNVFLVKLNDVQRYHIMIYDRRGQLVFESFDPEKPWDGTSQNGKKCPQGVYTYIVSGHKITYPYDQLLYKGTVVLIR